jgi:hypothetical protein
MKLNFLILLMLSVALASNAQISSKPQMPQTSIKAAYLGSIVYPGFKVGIERPYKVIQVEKHRKNGTKTILKERSLTANLGFYHHETFHNNFYLLFERQKRRQKMNGWFSEIAPGLGYSRTFLGGTTYKVDENGEVSKKSAAGYNYVMASVAFGGGYNFAMKKDLPIKAYYKVSLFTMFPYNSFVYLRPTVELGATYSLRNFWKANPTLKTRVKRKN